MSNARAAREILRGMDEAIDNRLARNLPISDATWAKRAELEAEARERDWSSSCRCGAWESGADCMCHEND